MSVQFDIKQNQISSEPFYQPQSDEIGPPDKKGELIHAHPDFQLVISHNPDYQSLMKDIKQSTSFAAMEFDYALAGVEADIVSREAAIDADTAGRLVIIEVSPWPVSPWPCANSALPASCTRSTPRLQN